MSRRKDWDERVFKALLHDHEPPQAGDGLRERIEADLARTGMRVTPISVAHINGPAARVWRLTAVAATLAILIGGLAWVAWDAPRFDKALLVTRSPSSGTAGTGVVTTQKLERGTIIATYEGESVRVEGDGNVLELGDNTRLTINTALGHRLGIGGLEYGLEIGKLDLVHGPTGPDFVLKTPFGSLVPLGTAFALTIEPGGKGGLILHLTVREGAVIFTETNTTKHKVIAGNYLRLEVQPKGSPGSARSGPMAAWPDDPNAESALGNNSSLEGSSRANPNPEAGAPMPDPAGAKPFWALAGFSAETQLFAAGQSLVTVRASKVNSIFLQTGKANWEESLPVKPQSVLVGSAIFCHTGRSVLALELNSGRQLWTQPAGPLAGGRLVEGQGRLWLASADGSIVSWDASTGQERSRWELGTGLYGTPLVGGNQIYVSQLPADFVALTADSGAVLWRFKAAARFIGDQPILLDSLIVVRDSAGTWHGLNSQTGVERFAFPGKGRLEWGPVVLGGSVWAQENGSLFNLDKNGVQNRHPQIRGRVFDLRLTDSQVQAATSDGLVLFKPDSQVGLNKPTQDKVLRNALIVGNTLVGIDQDGRLNARSLP